MYTAIPVNQSIDDGERLIEKLEEKNFPISAALWRPLEKRFADEGEIWCLLIVSPMVDKEGPLRSYMHISEALDELGNSVHFSISDISAVSPKWTEFRDLRRAIENAGAGRIATMGRPAGSARGGTVEDFYVYRWNPDRV